MNFDTKASTIVSELNAATAKLDSKIRETNSFQVWKRRGATFLEITVQFEVDRTSSMTALQCFPIALDGNHTLPPSLLITILGPNPAVEVFQSQSHTPYPTGSFELVYGNVSIDGIDFSSLRTSIPWDASGDVVETAIETLFPDDLVNVSPPFASPQLMISISCRWKSPDLVGV
jgi:hypothetical protein